MLRQTDDFFQLSLVRMYQQLLQITASSREGEEMSKKKKSLSSLNIYYGMKRQLILTMINCKKS